MGREKNHRLWTSVSNHGFLTTYVSCWHRGFWIFGPFRRYFGSDGPLRPAAEYGCSRKRNDRNDIHFRKKAAQLTKKRTSAGARARSLSDEGDAVTRKVLRELGHARDDETSGQKALKTDLKEKGDMMIGKRKWEKGKKGERGRQQGDWNNNWRGKQWANRDWSANGWAEFNNKLTDKPDQSTQSDRAPDPDKRKKNPHRLGRLHPSISGRARK